MRSSLFLLLAALTLPLSAEKVSFDTDDRFSIEFPETWVKSKAQKENALVHRQHKDGDGLFSISRLVVPPGRNPDLHAALKSFVANYRKAGMTIMADVKGQEGQIDGKKAIFASVPATIKAGDESVDLSFFLVLIDAPERLLILEATLPGKGANALRADCRKIIGSFEEKKPGEAKKEEDEKNEEKPE